MYLDHAMKEREEQNISFIGHLSGYKFQYIVLSKEKKYHTSIVISLFEIPNGICVIDIVTITTKCSQAIFNFNIVTIIMLRNVLFL